MLADPQNSRGVRHPAAGGPRLHWDQGATWGFPKIKGTILRVPVIWTIVFWGLFWGPLILGNYHLDVDSGFGFWGLAFRVHGVPIAGIMVFCCLGIVSEPSSWNPPRSSKFGLAELGFEFKFFRIDFCRLLDRGNRALGFRA